MNDDDLIAAAIDELYAHEPAEFTKRRQALVAAARRGGAGAAAQQIGGLRRPTRAAWILNQLARGNRQLATDFGELGGQLRQAHEALDGAQIRELTKQRRQLIDQTAAQAFAAAGIAAPTAALRDDVVETLGAVLADDTVAAAFAAGTLITAADQSGFGPVGPVLTAVPALTLAPQQSATQQPAAQRPAAQRASAKEAREQQRQQAAIAKAEEAVEAARAALQVAEDARDDAARSSHQLAEQLADAKRREDDATLAARHAGLQLEKAQQALVRVRQ